MDQLIPLVYQQLLSLARRRMSLEAPDHTELVHEAYLRLVHSEISAKNRAHFYAICAQLMRRILVDHAKTNLPGERKEAVKILSAPDYEGFGPRWAAEYLGSKHGIEASKETVQKWMIEGELWRAKKEKVNQIHVWRPRKERFGEMVQWDTSTHDWSEGRGETV